MEDFDFCGWATKNDLLCSDGRIIRKDAFKAQDGKTVPLVWNHGHTELKNIIGHALLKNKPEGIRVYGKFNTDLEDGRMAKSMVDHGDLNALSIFANQLIQRNSDVLHGTIREVSLVLAGANPGAFIDQVIKHGEAMDDEFVLYTGEEISIYHSDDEKDENEKNSNDEVETESDKKIDLENNSLENDETASIAHADEEEKKVEDIKKPESEETIADVYNTFNEKQKEVVNAMIGLALEEAEESDDNFEGGNETMKHNVFDQEEQKNENVLSHDAMNAIIGDAKRFGSMKESFLQHAETYGIDQIDYLFPDAKNVTATPQFIKRDTGWVQDVMGGVHHTPFSRIKSMFADITEDEARAKGYIKGNLKKEEVFSLLKRTTTPTTVYKKQKMDRDDVVDITDFDVVAWLKTEMRWMLDEEIARAVLVGDGRLASSDDKINEQCIRPIWTDSELYTIKTIVTVTGSATEDEKAKAFIKAAIKSRKNYKGSGNPVLYTTEDFLTDMLLLTDTTGRDLYESVEKLAKKLRVSRIVTVPVMEGLKTSEGNTLMGIIVNMADYNIGADKGGSVNMFDDFDIDYNQQKYLIETRCSGALIKPYSAIAIEMKVSG